MAIVMISSKFQGGQDELAARVAEKTGWPLLCRQELLDEARTKGIKVGRLEMSVIKPRGPSERMAREKNLYLAYLTATLCEHAKDGNLIYHGRAGQLLLPGVSHRLRVGLTMPHDTRVRRTARVLGMSEDRAETYLNQLDEDVEKWIKYVHRVDSLSPERYDVQFNLEHLGLSNAAGLLCDMAALPDYRPTPASVKRMVDLKLAAEARLRLAFDQRTAAEDLQVQTDDGTVTVTYPPSSEAVAKVVPDVLASLEGCRVIRCTMAETNILWIQERFDPESESFDHLAQVAQRWSSAVELLRLMPEEVSGESLDSSQTRNEGQRVDAQPDGGVEEDGPPPVEDDGGLDHTQEELVALGRFGGWRTVYGGARNLREAVNGDTQYSLVVIGDVFLSKDHSARVRKTRELALTIRDRLKAPVITADELRSRLMFGPAQAIKLLVSLVMVVAIYFLVFHFQEPVLDFLGGSMHEQWRWLTPLGVVLLVPLVAYLYGQVSGLALKLINID